MQYKNTGLAVFAAALLISGCVNTQKTIDPYYSQTPPPVAPAAAQPTVNQAEQADHARKVLMPALALISGRIANYEQKLNSWHKLQSRQVSLNLSPDQAMEVTTCTNKVTDLHTAYQRLHSDLLSEQSVVASRQLISGSLQVLEQKDMNYLEGSCPKLISSLNTTKITPVVIPATQTVDLSLLTALNNGDYSTVIRSYEAMNLSAGKQAENGAAYAYGTALLKSGREQEGQQVFEELLGRVRQQGQGNWELTLLQQLADLDFGLKNYPAARNRYEELNQAYAGLNAVNVRTQQQMSALDAAEIKADEIRDYAALLLSYQTYNPQRDGFTVVQQAQAFTQKYPVSTVSSTVSELTTKAGQDAEQWFAGLLSRADQLNADGYGQQALQLLEQVPLDILPMNKQDILNQKKETLAANLNNNGVPGSVMPAEVPVDENMDLPKPEPIIHVPVTALQETWNQGILHLKAREYDQAITVFAGLSNTSYGTRAELKIIEASRLAAKEERTKAAELFQRANSATDTENRKQLLLSSRSLLMGILQKYPQAGIEDKVRRNLNRLNRELASIEQAEMLIQPDSLNGSGKIEEQPLSQ